MKKIDFVDDDALQNYLKKKGIPTNESIIDELKSSFNTLLESKIRQEKNKGRITKNDSAKESKPALEALSQDQIDSLPSLRIGVPVNMRTYFAFANAEFALSPQAASTAA